MFTIQNPKYGGKVGCGNGNVTAAINKTHNHALTVWF